MNKRYTGYLLNKKEKDDVGKIPSIEQDIKYIKSNTGSDGSNLSIADRENLNKINDIDNEITILIHMYGTWKTCLKKLKIQ